MNTLSNLLVHQIFTNFNVNVLAMLSLTNKDMYTSIKMYTYHKLLNPLQSLALQNEGINMENSINGDTMEIYSEHNYNYNKCIKCKKMHIYDTSRPDLFYDNDKLVICTECERIACNHPIHESCKDSIFKFCDCGERYCNRCVNDHLEVCDKCKTVRCTECKTEGTYSCVCTSFNECCVSTHLFNCSKCHQVYCNRCANDTLLVCEKCTTATCTECIRYIRYDCEDKYTCIECEISFNECCASTYLFTCSKCEQVYCVDCNKEQNNKTCLECYGENCIK
jgi:hypothetical protein